jgi:hypothetical protein
VCIYILHAINYPISSGYRLQKWPPAVKNSRKYTNTNRWDSRQGMAFRFEGSPVNAHRQRKTLYVPRQRKDVPWTLEMTELDVSSFLPTVVFPSSALWYVNQPKVLFASKLYLLLPEFLWGEPVGDWTKTYGNTLKAGDNETLVIWLTLSC